MEDFNFIQPDRQIENYKPNLTSSECSKVPDIVYLSNIELSEKGYNYTYLRVRISTPEMMVCQLVL